jgi:type IV pilus assembly protein PilA
MFKSNKQAGQGMTEYIIIVALVAIAAIGVYSAFGKTIRGQMGVVAGSLAGTATTESRTEADEGSNTARDQAQRDVSLEDFEDNE